MSEGDKLPADDTLAIHCQPSKMGVHGVAAPPLFQPRIGEDDYLSGAWLEQTGLKKRTDQIREVCRQMNESGFRTLRASHKLALLLVSSAQDTVRTKIEYELEFIHHPRPNYESHSGIHGIEQDSENISVELAETCKMALVILS